MGEHHGDEQHVAADRHEDDGGQHEGEQPRAAASDVPGAGGERADVVASHGAGQARVGHGAGWRRAPKGSSSGATRCNAS